MLPEPEHRAKVATEALYPPGWKGSGNQLFTEGGRGILGISFQPSPFQLREKRLF